MSTVSLAITHRYYDNRDWNGVVSSVIPLEMQAYGKNTDEWTGNSGVVGTSASSGCVNATTSTGTITDGETFDWLECNIHHLQLMRSVLIVQAMLGNHTSNETKKELSQTSPLLEAATAASAGFSVAMLDLCTRKQIFLQDMHRFLAKSRPAW